MSISDVEERHRLTKSCGAVKMRRPIRGYINSHQKADRDQDGSDDTKTKTQALFAPNISLDSLVIIMISDFLRETECLDSIYCDGLDGLVRSS
jgi:hypothetical protein